MYYLSFILFQNYLNKSLLKKLTEKRSKTGAGRYISEPASVVSN